MNPVFIGPLAVAAFFAAGIGFSIHSRQQRGEPLIPAPPADASFCEGWATGYGRFNAHAGNCLMVAVTASDLWIAIRFPFNLFLPYGLFGLEFHGPKEQVVRAELRRALFWKTVLVELAAGNGRSQTISLRLRNPEGFLAALGR